MSFDLKALVSKLNATSRKAVEASIAACVARSNYEVDPEHLLLSLLDIPNCDVLRILGYFEVDLGRMSRDLTKALDRLKSGNSRSPTLSPRIMRLLGDAWGFASIDLGDREIRSGALLVATLSSEDLGRLVQESSVEFLKINLTTLRQSWSSIVAGSIEDPRHRFGGARRRSSREFFALRHTESGSIHHRPDGGRSLRRA